MVDVAPLLSTDRRRFRFGRWRNTRRHGGGDRKNGFGLQSGFADNIARLLFSVEVPIGILTSLIGIPFFAFVLRKARKGWH